MSKCINFINWYEHKKSKLIIEMNNPKIENDNQIEMLDYYNRQLKTLNDA